MASIFVFLKISRIIFFQFDDVVGHWAEDEIEVMTAHHIINGMTEDTFLPNESVTRAQSASIIYRLFFE